MRAAGPPVREYELAEFVLISPSARSALR